MEMPSFCRFVPWLALAVCAFSAEQQFAEIRDLKLDNGQTVASCKVGYRTIGSLNAEKSNAILWPTWFGGKSANLEAFAGPGKPVDPEKYFVIFVDALGNGVSCSPSNSSPALAKLTIADMVRSQYRLVKEHFKLTRLHAVMGISMGGMQTFEWMTAHPGFLSRAIPIIGSPKLSSIDLLLWQAELTPIEEAEARNGDLRAAMKTVMAIHRFALETPEYRAAQTPAAAWPEYWKSITEAAQSSIDPRDWAAQLRAMMAQDVTRHYNGSLQQAAAAVRGPVLVIAATQDHMVNPLSSFEMARFGGFEVLKLESNCGHMATSCEAGRMADAIARFLEK